MAFDLTLKVAAATAVAAARTITRPRLRLVLRYQWFDKKWWGALGGVYETYRKTREGTDGEVGLVVFMVSYMLRKRDLFSMFGS
jgi:hypothetical protein